MAVQARVSTIMSDDVKEQVRHTNTEGAHHRQRLAEKTHPSSSCQCPREGAPAAWRRFPHPWPLCPCPPAGERVGAVPPERDQGGGGDGGVVHGGGLPHRDRQGRAEPQGGLHKGRGQRHDGPHLGPAQPRCGKATATRGTCLSHYQAKTMIDTHARVLLVDHLTPYPLSRP